MNGLHTQVFQNYYRLIYGLLKKTQDSFLNQFASILFVFKLFLALFCFVFVLKLISPYLFFPQKLTKCVVLW